MCVHLCCKQNTTQNRSFSHSRQNPRIRLSSVLRPRQHSIGYMGDWFYRSKDPTNSILKRRLLKRDITDREHTRSRNQDNKPTFLSHTLHHALTLTAKLQQCLFYNITNLTDTECKSRIIIINVYSYSISVKA